MTPKKHIILYSHGFGVRKDDRGLFTSIAQALPDAKHVMFDYCPINERANTLTAKPLKDQVQRLRKILNNVRAMHQGAVIDIVCHSQGCVVAALLKPRDIRKIIMLAPPDDVRAETVARQLSVALATPIDMAVKTRLKRKDGSTTVVPPEYWPSLDGVEPVKLYNRLARFTQLRIVKARQDDILGDVAFTGLEPSVSLITLDGNHNFDESESRQRLLYILNKELVS